MTMKWTSRMTIARMTTNTVGRLSRYFAPSDAYRLNFRYRRDGETDRSHEGHDFRSEAVEEGKAAEEARSPAAYSRCLQSKKPTTKKSGKKSAAFPGDDDVLTFEQKKDLSEAIQTLDSQNLERVIRIIHEGVPEIRDECLLTFLLICFSY
jgi:hypothetical protein